MASYSDLRKTAARGKYANGGRIPGRTGKPTVININVQPPVSAPPASPVGASAAPAPSPAPSGPPVPPQAAAMALAQMQGKPQMPGAFANGGRVKGGAASGVGRLQNEKAQGSKSPAISKVKVKGGR